MRGVRRSVKYENTVNNFCNAQDDFEGKSIFPTMREFMCFVAALGFQFGKRVPFEGSDKFFEIDGRIFSSNNEAIDLMNTIALIEQRDAKILKLENINDTIAIFEEYANGGFGILEEWFKRKPDDHMGHKAVMVALKDEGFLGGASESKGDRHDVIF